MEQVIKVPSPAEILESSQVAMTKTTVVLLQAVITILRERYVGNKITVRLKEITAKAGILHAKHDDWEKMEFELKKVGWAIGFESPDRDQNFDSYYTFSSKK